MHSNAEKVISNRNAEPVNDLKGAMCRAADPVLATDVSGLRPRLLLPQHRNDPLFRELRLLHLRLPQGDGFYLFLEEVQGLR
jgi:hypothetical protein